MTDADQPKTRLRRRDDDELCDLCGALPGFTCKNTFDGTVYPDMSFKHLQVDATEHLTLELAALRSQLAEQTAENERLRRCLQGKLPAEPPRLVGAEPVTCFGCERLNERLSDSEQQRAELQQDLNDARNGWERAVETVRELDDKLADSEQRRERMRAVLTGVHSTLLSEARITCSKRPSVAAWLRLFASTIEPELGAPPEAKPAEATCIWASETAACFEATIAGSDCCATHTPNKTEAKAACHCAEGGPGSYDGPQRDCPVHGEAKPAEGATTGPTDQKQEGNVCKFCGVDHRPYYYCSDAKRDAEHRAAWYGAWYGRAGAGEG